LKALGFKFATRSGISVAMTDMDIPAKRDEIIESTEREVESKNQQYMDGLITQAEREQHVLELWLKAAEEVHQAIMDTIDEYNSINIITTSGARGSKRQITQLSGMRGLMSGPFGNLIEDLPIKSNFHEGLHVLEYFISTHGARKGLADTALRTADAGYLTRRLVDVAQDVIVRGYDCETTSGIFVREVKDAGEVIETVGDRVRGRTALEDVIAPADIELPSGVSYKAGDVIARSGEVISDDQAQAITALRVKEVGIRSPLTCQLRFGICSKCYGRDLSTHRLVDEGTAVGIIAAQSIGEPGTQLTMRTFHTGGVAGQYLTGVADVKKRRQQSLRELHEDISLGLLSLEESHERERVRKVQALLKVQEDQVRGLLRVVELFEARKPKGQAITTEHSGIVVDIESKGARRVVINSTYNPKDDPKALVGLITATDVIHPEKQEVMIPAGTELTDKLVKRIIDASVPAVTIRRNYLVPHRGNLEVKPGDEVRAGDRLTEGPLNPHRVLELQGVRGCQEYLVVEIQKVYKSQGVDINDKHIEIIVRQMLRRRRIREAGDTRFLPGKIVDRFEFEEENRRVKEANPDAREATADPILLGITEASLATNSFLSAASFQKTTRVLTDAAVRGKSDPLLGLKENVIIGRLIPAGTGLRSFRDVEVEMPDQDSMVIKEILEKEPLPEDIEMGDLLSLSDEEFLAFEEGEIEDLGSAEVEGVVVEEEPEEEEDVVSDEEDALTIEDEFAGMPITDLSDASDEDEVDSDSEDDSIADTDN
jgi:DNA-directed RNA polymerase subunit beta'